MSLKWTGQQAIPISILLKLYGIFKKVVFKHQRKPKRELKECLRKAWTAIDTRTCRDLFKSMTAESCQSSWQKRETIVLIIYFVQVYLFYHMGRDSIYFYSYSIW